MAAETAEVLESEIKSTYKVRVVQAADVPLALEDSDPNKPVALICTMYAWQSMQDWFARGLKGMGHLKLSLAEFYKERGIPVFLADREHNLMNCISDIIGMHPDAQIIRVV